MQVGRNKHPPAVDSPEKTALAMGSKAVAAPAAGNRTAAHQSDPSLATGHAAAGDVAVTARSRAGFSIADPGAKPAGLLVVGAMPEGDGQFSTLAAACAAAHNGDVIELQFDGPREERPVKISNLKITIRAGAGYRPVVVFRPTDIDPVKYSRSMLALSGGQVRLVDVGLELQVPRGVPADQWTLLETWGGEMLRLERCWLEVQNASQQGVAYHQDAAFFRARSAPDAETALGGVPAATPLATIELADCIARGEADFLHLEGLQPVHLSWDNGLLITSERMVEAGGIQSAPKLDEVLRIELRHVTAAVYGGLCRMTGTFSNPYQLTVQFVSSDSIFLASPGVPLVEQESAASIEDLRQRFMWNGDRNSYQNVDPFWIVRNFGPRESLGNDRLRRLEELLGAVSRKLAQH